MLPVPKVPPKPHLLFDAAHVKAQGAIHVLVGGRAGSGFEDLTAAIVDELGALKVAVESVEDETFHLAVTTCELCACNGRA